MKRPRDATTLGPFLMLSAALQFTVMNFTIKLMGPHFSAWHIAFYRFAGSVLVLLLLFGPRGNPYRGHNYRLLILRGLTGSAAFLCIVAAIRLLPLSTAMVIIYSQPAFAAFFAVWLYGDRIRWSEGGCILLVLAGAWILFEFKASGRPLGEILALLGAIFFGLTVTLIRSLRRHNGPVVIYLYFCTMGMLITLPAFAAHPRLPANPYQWLLLVVLVIFSVTAQVSMNHGYLYCRSWEGGLYMTTDALFSVLAGIVFLGETATWRLYGGGGLILGGVVAISLLNARHQLNAGAPPPELPRRSRRENGPR